MVRIGFLGFGEAGSCFARVARSAGADVAAFDHNVARRTAKAGEKQSLADELGVVLHADPAGLRDRDIVVSVVAPRTAVNAATSYASVARAGQVYVDLNSTTPGIKSRVAELLAPAGVTVIDGVLLGGGVRLDGDEVPIVLAGTDSATVASQLRGLGLNVSALAGDLGAASALKMLRSAAIKSFEATCVEMLMAARRYGLVEDVLRELTDIFDRFPARTLIEHLVQSHADHCGRRAGEVEMVRETIAGQGVDTVMATAALAVFERSARAPAPRPWDDARSLAEILDHLGRAMDEDRMTSGR